MMHQTESHGEFFGMFFGDIALGGDFLCHGGKVVVASEVETHHILDFAVAHFGDIEVIRAFFFIAFAITVHDYSIFGFVCIKRDICPDVRR